MQQDEVLTTKDGSKTIRHALLDETYHSMHGARQEALHVFIKNGIEFFKHENEVHVFEVGFGTGLNVLLTLEYAEKNQQKIHYHTIEAYPISLENAQQLDFQNFLEEKNRPWVSKLHELHWNQEHALTSYFYFQKILQKMEDFQPEKEAYHCIYFDAFSPTSQPEMWSIEILQKMYDSLYEKGLLVTYCAKGQFKRDLINCGFEVEKIPGPPGKREMTLAWKK